MCATKQGVDIHFVVSRLQCLNAYLAAVQNATQHTATEPTMVLEVITVTVIKASQIAALLKALLMDNPCTLHKFWMK